MADFFDLVTEFSTPDDRAIYEQYVEDIAKFTAYAKEQQANVEAELEKKSKKTLKRRVTEFFSSKTKEKNRLELFTLRAKSIEWKNAARSPEEFIRENNRQEKCFIELPTGAKEYAVLKKITDEAAKAGETDVNKVRETFKTFQKNLQEHPLVYTSPQHCLSRIDAKKHKGADSWSKIVENAETIRRNAEEKREFSDIKHVSLTKFFKGRFCDKYSEVIDVITKCQVKREAGCLPPEWIAVIPKEQIPEKTKQISQILQDFSKRTHSDKSVPEHMLEPAIKDLSKQLSGALNTPVEVSFLGNGAIGKAVKLVTNNGKSLVLKTNHSNPKYGVECGHGVQIEAARGIFVSSNNDRKKYAQTYFTRLGDVNASDSFMISRFVEKKDKAQAISKNIKTNIEKDGMIVRKHAEDRNELLQVVNVDTHEDNLVNDVCIDLGGCYIPEHMRDPKCYKLYKTLYRSLKRKDGPELINKIVNGCEKNPVLRNKLKTVKKAMQRSLHYNPDIDFEGRVNDYGFRPECMEALGVSNQVDIFRALDCAKDKKTVDYIISSRGGPKNVGKMLEQTGKKEQNYVPLLAARYLIDGNIPSESIAPFIQEDDVIYFNKLAQTHSEKSANSSNSQGMSVIQQQEKRLRG